VGSVDLTLDPKGSREITAAPCTVQGSGKIVTISLLVVGVGAVGNILYVVGSVEVKVIQPG
jgi:hypothetical protein